jgi:Mce-associated membrane protein
MRRRSQQPEVDANAVDEADTVVADDKATEQRRPRRPGLFTVLMVLLALAGTAAGGTTWRVEQLSQREAASAAALEAVRERLPELLSYRFATLEEDLEEALAQTTGDFTAEYGALIDEVVRTTATQRRIITEASVNGAGVVAVESHEEVLVLVFLTQSTTSRSSSDPATSGSRVEVTMRQEGSDWLIAGLRTR